MMSPSKESTWYKCQRRFRTFRLALLVAIIWILIGSVIASLFGYGSNDASAFIWTVVLLMLLIAVAHLRRMFWPCPRCGRAFHVSWWYGNPWVLRCVHCDLPKAPVGTNFP